MRNHKFRLYPSDEQEKKLLWTLDRCRFAYNKLLEGLQKQWLQKNNRDKFSESVEEILVEKLKSEGEL